MVFDPPTEISVPILSTCSVIHQTSWLFHASYGPVVWGSGDLETMTDCGTAGAMSGSEWAAVPFSPTTAGRSSYSSWWHWWHWWSWHVSWLQEIQVTPSPGGVRARKLNTLHGVHRAVGFWVHVGPGKMSWPCIRLSINCNTARKRWQKAKTCAQLAEAPLFCLFVMSITMSIHMSLDTWLHVQAAGGLIIRENSRMAVKKWHE